LGVGANLTQGSGCSEAYLGIGILQSFDKCGDALLGFRTHFSQRLGGVLAMFGLRTLKVLNQRLDGFFPSSAPD